MSNSPHHRSQRQRHSLAAFRREVNTFLFRSTVFTDFVALTVVPPTVTAFCIRAYPQQWQIREEGTDHLPFVCGDVKLCAKFEGSLADK